MGAPNKFDFIWFPVSVPLLLISVGRNTFFGPAGHGGPFGPDPILSDDIFGGPKQLSISYGFPYLSQPARADNGAKGPSFPQGLAPAAQRGGTLVIN